MTTPTANSGAVEERYQSVFGDVSRIVESVPGHRPPVR